jgi:SAM-dependent methyltransferase
VTRPWPTGEELDEAYGGFYRPRSGRFSGPGDWLLRRSRGSLSGRIDALAPPGAVLDVGAGDGTLVAALCRTGREARGLEREDPPMDDLSGPFAAVVLWQSLEHLPAPAAALREAARLLAPDGRLFVAVPNAASLQARLFGSGWLGWDLPRHLVHLPRRTLLEGIAEAGFELTRESHWRGGGLIFGWLHGLVGRTTGLDLYDAIRRPEARAAPLGAAQRATALLIGSLLWPVAALGAAVEVATRRGGTVYVEARRP